MKTQADLVVAVLEDLMILEVGQSVTPEDSDTITRRLQPKVEELNARDICYIPDTDNIGDEYFLPLVRIMSAECAPAFGVSKSDREVLEAKASQAENTLRDIVSNQGTNQMLVTEPGLWRGQNGRWWG